VCFPLGEGRTPEKHKETQRNPEQGETRGDPNIQIYPDIAVSFLGVLSPWGRENPRETQRNPKKHRSKEKPCGTRGGLISADIRFAGLLVCPRGVPGEDTPFYFLCVLSLAVWGERGEQRGV
jgi:hypothetical protein